MDYKLLIICLIIKIILIYPVLTSTDQEIDKETFQDICGNYELDAAIAKYLFYNDVLKRVEYKPDLWAPTGSSVKLKI
jgi:hypothetical protein